MASRAAALRPARPAAAVSRHFESFLEMLMAERGAAANTIESYRRDLSDCAAFLIAHAGPHGVLEKKSAMSASRPGALRADRLV